MAKHKQHSATFKSRVAFEALQGGLTIVEPASKYEIHPAMVTNWKKQAVGGLTELFSSKGRKIRANIHEAEICEAALEEAIGQYCKPESIPTRAAGSPPWSSPMCSRTTTSPSPWTARAAGWTTFSSSGCGGR